MREVKFRAVLKEEYGDVFVTDGYAGDTGMLWHLFDFNSESAGERFVNEALCTDKFRLSKKNIDFGWYILEIQQYIGLKDKNGVEIYEGDVFDYAGIEIIEYHMGAFGYWIWKNERYRRFVPICETPILSEIIIIGNIYENPELMEKQNER